MNGGLKICAWATGGRFGSGVYEVHKDGKYAGLVSVNRMKQLGLVKRIDHTKKAVEFLNTEAGQKWFEAARFH